MLIKKVTKNLLLTTLAFLVIVGIVAFSVYILFSTNKKNEKYNDTLKEYSGGNTDIGILKQDIKKAIITKETLVKWLLAPDQTLELIQYIETVSSVANLNPKITDLNPQKVSSGNQEGDTALELIISLEGTFEQTQKFLRVMENIPYQSFVREMQLQRRGGENIDLWQIKVQLIVYTKPLPKNNKN